MHKRRPRNTLRRDLTMSRRRLALLAVATIVVGCYKEDITTRGASRKPIAKGRSGLTRSRTARV